MSLEFPLVSGCLSFNLYPLNQGGAGGIFEVYFIRVRFAIK